MTGRQMNSLPMIRRCMRGQADNGGVVGDRGVPLWWVVMDHPTYPVSTLILLSVRDDLLPSVSQISAQETARQWRARRAAVSA